MSNKHYTEHIRWAAHNLHGSDDIEIQWGDRDMRISSDDSYYYVPALIRIDKSDVAEYMEAYGSVTR